MAKRKQELIELCGQLGVQLNPNVKYRNKDLVHLLGQKHIEKGTRKLTWALNERINLDSPMLCQWYKNLKDNQKKHIMEDSNEWVAERKWNGVRMVCFYHPDFGFQFFSRHHSEIDFLPIEYDNLLINVGNDFLDGASYKGKYKFPFIIDTEVITSEKDLDLTILPKNMNKVSFGGLGSPKPSFMINSELNAACSIIQYNKDDSYLLQKSNPLIFQVFDVIMVNNIYLYNQPLKKRLEFLQELMKYLPPCFRPCELVNVSKMNYYEKLIENENAEGIVLKSLLSPYNNSGTRHADKWVKLKRSLAETVGDDLDVFVTGYNEGTGKNEGLVGSIEFSVYLRDKNGLLREHVIANIGGLSDNFRRFITDTSDGKPRLRKELYGKVFVINGHTVSARNLRFNHAVLVNEMPRLDKNASQCDLDEEVLRANIL